MINNNRLFSMKLNDERERETEGKRLTIKILKKVQI